MAMGRSKPEPSFLMSAGARLMVMRVGGMSKPEFLMAERTRSRDSRTAASGRPTVVNSFFVEDDAGEVDFDVDDVGVDAVDGGTAGFEEHRRPLLCVKSGRDESTPAGGRRIVLVVTGAGAGHSLRCCPCR